MPESWNTSVSVYTFGKAYLAACLFISIIQKGYTLNCVQCMSLVEEDCVSGDVKPTPCKDQDKHAPYCHTAIGDALVGSGYFVSRTCSRIALNNCTHERIKYKKNHEGTMYKVCHRSCSTEGCNNAVRGSLHIALRIVSVCIAAQRLLSLPYLQEC